MRVIRTLLVANRGEIACRIFRTARRMGIRTIAVYSEADTHALHVKSADQAVCIGPANATESYLNIDAVIEAAKISQAEAIHPGYGFLSENAQFALACERAGIIFVGPPAQAIQTMGSKVAAKQLMQSAGIPVLPGYHGADQDPEYLAAQAAEVGYPLLIKASAGGGGKGMRLVTEAADFADQLASAKREARSAFGDDVVLLERYLTAPKHIEVQLMADQHGDVVHLLERDCSVQRRHQKVVEEAPGPTVSSQLRNRLGQTAVMVAKQVGYVGAGTVEFIAEGDDFYFMEMNTRLQVEHPVTEAITGLDLVELQLNVAAGEPLGLTQSDIVLNGHAIEVRLYAENPAKNFLPSTGKLLRYDLPDSIRVDTGVQAGDSVSMHYDPMLAKLIAHAPDRHTAIAHLVSALLKCRIAGIEHNLGYLTGMLSHPQFKAGTYTTGIADAVHNDVVPDRKDEFAALAGEYVLRRERGHTTSASGWAGTGFRLNQAPESKAVVRQGKVQYEVEVRAEDTLVNDKVVPQKNLSSAEVLADGEVLYVMADGHTEKYIDLTDDMSRYLNQSLSAAGIVAPMPGAVIAVNVQVGDKVKVNDVLVVVEAMKMEHSIRAAKNGVVKQVKCAVGDRVEEGLELIEVQ
ncbi:MAG: acetyl/propionyl/methylcrotonyl-CoA carboxylase subunit alpha [bacterium]